MGFTPSMRNKRGKETVSWHSGLPSASMEGDSRHPPHMKPNHTLTRRDFLGRSTKLSALGLLAAGLPTGWLGAETVSDSPETAKINFGIIALTDCSPIVIAHVMGFLKKHGIVSSVT